MTALIAVLIPNVSGFLIAFSAEKDIRRLIIWNGMINNRNAKEESINADKLILLNSQIPLRLID